LCFSKSASSRSVLCCTRSSQLSQSRGLITPLKLWTQNQSSRSIEIAFFILGTYSFPYRFPADVALATHQLDQSQQAGDVCNHEILRQREQSRIDPDAHHQRRCPRCEIKHYLRGEHRRVEKTVPRQQRRRDEHDDQK